MDLERSADWKRCGLSPTLIPFANRLRARPFTPCPSLLGHANPAGTSTHLKSWRPDVAMHRPGTRDRVANAGAAAKLSTLLYAFRLKADNVFILWRAAGITSLLVTGEQILPENRTGLRTCFPFFSPLLSLYAAYIFDRCFYIPLAVIF